MDKKTLFAAIGVVLLIAVVGCFLPAGNPITPNVVERTKESFGALSGPDISSPYLQWGGVHEYRASMDMAATSSIPCSLQSPAATSTLLSFTANVSSLGNMKSTDFFTVSTSSVAYGSSTPSLIYEATLAKGLGIPYAWYPVMASTTAADVGRVLVAVNKDGTSNVIFAPNTYLNMRFATATAGTFISYLSGSCKARFQTL